MSRGPSGKLRVVVAVGLFVLVAGLVQARSPWTQKRGEGFFQLAYYSIGPYDRLFQSSGGEFRTNRKITDSTLSVYGEYGVTDRWTVVGSIPVKGLDAGDQVATPTISPTVIQSGSVSTLGNLRFGARRRFVDRKWILSGQLDIELPTGSFDQATGLSSGYDAYTLAPLVGVGRGWNKAYVYGYGGFGLRSDDFSSDWVAGVEGGYRLAKPFWLVGLFDIRQSFFNGDVVLDPRNLQTGLYVNNQEFVAYGLKALIDLGKHFGLQATYYSAAQGNAVPKSSLIGFGFYYKLLRKR